MQTHTDGVFGDYDAIASFDRIAMSLMIPMARRVGGPLAHATCCFKNFQAMEYKISTGYGASDVSYTSTPENRLQGSDQGGSQSPTFCTNSSDVIMDVFNEKGHPIEFEHCYGDPTRRASRTWTNMLTTSRMEQLRQETTHQSVSENLRKSPISQMIF